MAYLFENEYLTIKVKEHHVFFTDENGKKYESMIIDFNVLKPFNVTNGNITIMGRMKKSFVTNELIPTLTVEDNFNRKTYSISNVCELRLIDNILNFLKQNEFIPVGNSQE